MKRFLIEFYSKRTPENLISLLNESFDGIYFLYFEGDEMPSPATRGRICDLTQELLGFEPRFLAVKEARVENVLDVFSSFAEEANRYDFDLTGGNEIFAAAAGIFLASNPKKKLFLHQYDVVTGEIVTRYPKSDPPSNTLPRYLGATQILNLNGTRVLAAPRPVFSYGPLKREVLRLWSAVKDRSKEWNLFCSMPTEFWGKKGITVRKCIGTGFPKRNAFNRITEALKKSGIVKEEREFVREGKLYAELSTDLSSDTLFLYEKAGNLLEMYCALCAHEAGLFHDICVGVTVDWDGTIEAPFRPDPQNEIDLVLMCRDLPVLASCKNTAPINDHLYEIATMTRHYGGYFATGMLLATEKASPTLRERAKEMGLILIDEIKKKKPEEMAAKFKDLFPR